MLLVLRGGNGLVDGVANWIVVDGAWRNTGTLLKIDEVGEDGTAAWAVGQHVEGS